MSSQVYAPSLVIRKSCREDAQAITLLMRQLRYPTTLSVMQERLAMLEHHPLECNLVAELDGKVIGTIGLKQLRTQDMGELVTRITSLVVDEQHRRKGIGKRLIAEVETWGKQQGSVQIFLPTDGERSSESKAFYEQVGFECNGYRLLKSIK